MKYKVGSLFAGVGGVCQAFKESSCDVMWANEIDSKACMTYRLNHNNTHLIEDDVKNLNANNLDEIDILTAGFPCQPFSQAGHGKGFNDERGELFFEVSRLLMDLKPKAYFLENVKTLATHDNRKTFNVIKDEIHQAGYSFIPFILNASKCTEIPQGRERIYIVGFKNEPNYSFEKPIEVNNKYDIVGCNLSKSFKIPEQLKQPSTNVRHFLDIESVNANDYYDNLENKIHQKINDAVKSEQIVYQYRRHYIRENKSNVCPTLTANMGAGGHNIPIILDNGVPRRLTPKECFNLQGFPKDYKFPEYVSRAQLYKQAGNSVVVPMVKKIAKEIIRVLDENRDSSTKS